MKSNAGFATRQHALSFLVKYNKKAEPTGSAF